LGKGFNIYPNEEKDKLNGGVTTFKFTPECADQTILINVQGTGTIKVSAAAMYDANNRLGYGEGGFSTCMTSSLLWNIPDATTVDIGNGKTSEFHGSLLVGGDLKMTTSGQSGRTMVIGDIYHDKGGSEFHSYEFNPPTPLPFDPKDLSCADLTNPGTGISALPTNAPTTPPTTSPGPGPTPASPTSTGCKKKGSKKNGVNDRKCTNKCIGTKPKYPKWPCNRDLCEGSECFFFP